MHVSAGSYWTGTNVLVPMYHSPTVNPEQSARELPRRGAGLECGADELARVYGDCGSGTGTIAVGVLELQGGHGN